MSETTALAPAVSSLERQLIIDALRRTHGNKRAAASQLNISRGTLYRRLNEFGLDGLIRKPLDGLPDEDATPDRAAS